MMVADLPGQGIFPPKKLRMPIRLPGIAVPGGDQAVPGDAQGGGAPGFQDDPRNGRKVMGGALRISADQDGAAGPEFAGMREGRKLAADVHLLAQLLTRLS